MHCTLLYLPIMSEFADLAALIVATTELSVVKDIRNAERATLIHAGGVPGPLSTIVMPKTVARERLVEPDVVYHRDVTTRVNDGPPSKSDAGSSGNGCCPSRVDASHAADSVAPRLANEPRTVDEVNADVAVELPLGKRLTPLVPPWRLPMPSSDAHAVRVVKWDAPKPDVICKGMLIDLFL